MLLLFKTEAQNILIVTSPKIYSTCYNILQNASWKDLRVKMTSPILHLYSRKQDGCGIVKQSIMCVTVDFNRHRF